jgi:GAF domain-containing protein
MTRLSIDSEWAGSLSQSLASAGQPEPAFKAFDDLCQKAFGHRLFTILAWQEGEDELQRVYSSRPVAYPVSARKRMGPTAWGEHVLRQGQLWLGSNAEDMRWAFPDHELIASLGCASCINAPVLWSGTVLGAINVLDAANTYTASDLKTLGDISGFLVGPLLALRQQAR